MELGPTQEEGSFLVMTGGKQEWKTESLHVYIVYRAASKNVRNVSAT